MGFLSKLFGRKKDEEKKEPLKIAEVEIDEILEKNEEISEEVKEKKETVQESIEKKVEKVEAKKEIEDDIKSEDNVKKNSEEAQVIKEVKDDRARTYSVDTLGRFYIKWKKSGKKREIFPYIKKKTILLENY